MNDAIEIVVSCGRYSDYYAEFFIRNCLETCSGEFPLIFSLGINNYPEFDNSKFDKFQKLANIKIQTINSNTVNGSEGHAIVLNKLVSDCSSRYCMIADCDLGFLTSDWDKKLVNDLDLKTGVVISGTEYNAHGAYPKYMNFPMALVCLFYTDIIKDLKIDFNTKTGASIVKTEEEAFLWERPIGSIIYLDTGWELPTRIKRAKLSGKILKYTNPSFGRGQEWIRDGAPFLAHFKGSSEKPPGNYDATQWMTAIDRYNSQFGHKKRSI